MATEFIRIHPQGSPDTAVTGDGALHVWWSLPLDWLAPEIEARALALLSPQEIKRYHRYRFEKDRGLFLAAHALLRLLLQRELEHDATAFTFSENEYGRPQLDAGFDQSLKFNITHTDGLVACAMCREAECGVDAEFRPRNIKLPGLVKRSFAPLEQSELWGLPASEHRWRFFQLWTLKEAYIKARGMGLALPLDGFWFHLNEKPPVRMSSKREIDPKPERWQFALHEPTAEHQLAMAAERHGDQNRSFEIYSVDPAALLHIVT